ncbi:hypothetical protein C1924_06105 [Stenotrophomonas sp. ESTM1D_MKCIP4_1]|uniref:hypothetical protein n=1 Tax=Stenotrophomonas sp. ESTM1D_MKCIP4_1 TaxID=2072414 RepID=UPI000D53CBA2|nr:hypothetical protein [Stenotrophomonas sp. ESTM1D_MKCIP4_1]AWH52776.1 hypothetical protein C1924_06105 [Stenotrophomonas sp. ESTM1D_MKCIP4_1]
MKDNLQILLAHVGRTFLFGLMMAIAPALAWLDIHWLGDAVGEWSLVELTQEGFLAASVAAFVRLAVRRADDRRFAVLAAALFACMFLREMDEALDLIAHGFWKYPVAALVAGSLAWASRDWRGTLQGLVRFLASRAGTVMTIGLVLLLVYSRLIGMTSLWSGLLGDQYIRVFKNAIEETTELLGYTFILAASVGYVAQRVREPRVAKRAPAHAMQPLH